MSALSNYLENLIIDGLFRGGALDTTGALNSAAVVKGLWTATTAYVIGDVVVPHASMTGAGGKFLRCTTAGTSGSTATLAIGNPASTVTDGGVTWTVVSGMPALLTTYFGLIVATKGERLNSTTYALNDTITLTANDGLRHLYKCSVAGTTGASQGATYPGVAGETTSPESGGTARFIEQSIDLDSNTLAIINEPTIGTGAYARIGVTASKVYWSPTQGPALTVASTGVTGTTSNNSPITFPFPTTSWAAGSAMAVGFVEYDKSTAGNLLRWGLFTTPKTINSGDPQPSFAAAALSFQIDN